MTVITRFAPSPTGPLHLGGARTALYNWLFAQNQGGEFILRYEDTDQARSSVDYKNSITQALTWLGITFPEPTNQLDKLDRYTEAAEYLISKGFAYYCDCTAERMAKLRLQQKNNHENTKYDGHCRNRNLHAQKGCVVRIKLPEQQKLYFDDLLRKTLSISTQQLDDFIIIRSNQVPTFNFAVIIDDFDQKISHVIRGDDHITNTFKQIVVAKRLSIDIPQFAHIPLIQNQSGKVLSKRDAASDLLHYRDIGFLPDAMCNYMLRLGWAQENHEYLTRDEMIRLFSISNLNLSACKIDPKKQLWFNREHIKNTDSRALLSLFKKYHNNTNLAKLISIYQGRTDTLNDLYEILEQFSAQKPPSQEVPVHIAHAIKDLTRDLINCNTWQENAIQECISNMLQTHSLKIKEVIPYIRFAFVGKQHGPSVAQLIEVSDKDIAISKLENTINQV